MNLSAIELSNPLALWLLIGVALYFALALLRKTGNLASVLIRVIALSLIVLALTDPTIKETNDERELTALFDVSSSVLPSGKRALVDQLMPYLQQGDDVRVSLETFGNDTNENVIEIDSSTSADELLSLVNKSAQKVDTGQTNIGSAVQRVTSGTSTSSLLLLSDGFDTKGDALAAAETAKASGMKIFPLVPDASAFQQGGIVLSSLHAPTTADAGDSVEILASVRNTLAENSSSQVEIWFGKKKLYANSISVPAGEERLVSVKTPAVEGGLHRVRAVVAQKSQSEAQTHHRWVSVKSKAKLLLLSGAKDDRRVISRLLNQRGYSVDDIVADGNDNVPTRFESYSLVIMNNIAKRQLPPPFLPKLKQWVENGGGLLLIGGDRSYGLGGYVNSELEEISPLKFVPPRTTKKRLNNAVVLVMDKSKSMVRENRIGAAKKAALSSIKALKDDDYVSVIGFDSAPFVVIRIKRVSEVKPIAESRLRRLTAAGRTDLLPALGEARRALRKAPASRKHIIVLSDGKFPLAGNSYVNEINTLRREGISVSTVALGIEADVPFMKLLAQQGKGAFYHTLDPSRLPEIFLHDIKVTTGEQTLREKQLYSIEVGPSGLQSTSIRYYPKLKGYVETKPKKGSSLELVLEHSRRYSPLLASWEYRDGAVTAFTSDANGRWSDPWVRWKNYSGFWSQIIESIQSRAAGEQAELDFDLRYNVEGDILLLDLVVFDQKSDSATSSVQASVREPGGEIRKAAFETVAPGRYQLRLDHARPGDYELKLRYGKTKLPNLAVTLEGSSFGEKEGEGINVQRLSNIAFLSGGSVNPDPDAVLGLSRSTEKTRHLFEPLVVLAFLLIILEAFVREFGMSLFTLFPFASKKKNSSGTSAKRKKLRKAA